jgi:hypothetical protein
MNIVLRCVRVAGIAEKFLKLPSKIHVSSFRAMSDEVSKAQDAQPGGER